MPFGMKPGNGAFSWDMLYFWMSPTMFLGKRRPLEHSDLPQLPTGDAVRDLLSRPRAKGPGTGTVKRLVLAEGPTLIKAGLCMLIYALCQVASPVILYFVIMCVEKGNGGTSKGGANALLVGDDVLNKDSMLQWLIAFTSCQLVAAFANHWQMHLAYHAGMRLRAQFICQVFKKALCVDPARRLPTGRVLNLMSTDAQKFLEALPFLHQLWSSPLQIVVATYFLIRLVGPSALFGVGALVAVVPLSRQTAMHLERYRRRHLTVADERIRLCVELLSGIRCIKYFAWERPYLERILERRRAELHWALREQIVFGMSMIFTVTAPIAAFAFTLFGRLLLEGDDADGISASRGFGTLALMIALRFPLMNLGSMLASIVALYASWHRMQDFLGRVDLGTPSATEDRGADDDVPLLFLKDCCLGHLPSDDSTNPFAVLTGVSLSVRKGELLVVLGKVGSGKSTLLQSIIGEVLLLDGVRHVRGAAAYCPQQPWVLNATLRDNVLFGEDFDEDWYRRVLDACCLAPDLKQLPEGDLTEIGERGVTLSGGQKQRVALARAVYQRSCRIVLLDDVFSALDAHTSRRAMQALLGPEGGLLRDRAVFIAAHGVACAEFADNVLVLSADGTGEAEVPKGPSFYGTWADYEEGHCQNTIATKSASESISPEGETRDGSTNEVLQQRIDDYESKDCCGSRLTTGSAISLDTKTQMKRSQTLMTQEEREYGGVSWTCIRLYVSCAGGTFWAAVFLMSAVVERVFICGSDWWLSRWTSEDPGNERTQYYASIFGAITVCGCLFVSASRLLVGPLSIWAAQGLFERMAVRVLRAPASWWDTTPFGRVMNRFSFDTDNIDATLLTKLFPAVMSLSWGLGSLTVMCGVLFPYSLLALPIPAACYAWLFQFSRKSIREMQRLDSISRSPIQSSFAEALHGLASVRAYGCVQRYEELLAELVDANSTAVLSFNTASRWLGVRLEMLGSSMTAAAGVGCWLLQDSLTPGLVGLCLMWSLNLTVSLNFNCMFWSQAEAAFTSVERVAQYIDGVPSEGQHQALDDWQRSREQRQLRTASQSSQALPPPPSSGSCLCFEEVSLRYREGLPLALSSISFKVASGERVAVVGRTGAGKSSLAVAIFRLAPLAKGTIRLGGVDMSSLPLDVARKCVGIITQDPVIFSGTVRYNLDPFQEYSDEECTEALARAQLASTLDLETVIDEGGTNRSVGERQLMCLARALLRRPSLLVCDEATSSVDARTDAQVQQVLRLASDSTSAALLTIAHRLATIADYDRILVLEAGCVAESGSPHELLAKRSGAFASLVARAGTREVEEVRRIAAAAAPWTGSRQADGSVESDAGEGARDEEV